MVLSPGTLKKSKISWSWLDTIVIIIENIWKYMEI